MPIVSLPDGREVEFPDNTPTDVMERAMRDFVAANPAGNGQRNQAVAGEISPSGANAARLGTQSSPSPSALGSFLRQAAQGAMLDYGDEAKAAIGSALGRGSYDELLGQARAQLEQDRQVNPLASMAGSLYGGIGGALAGGAAAGLAGGARAIAALPRWLQGAGRVVGGSALAGGVAGFGAGQGGAENRLAEATTGALVGGAVGAGVGAAGAALGRVISPVRPNLTPEQQGLRDLARARDIPMDAGQETGNRFVRNLSAQLEQLPLTAGPAADFRTAQKQAFTREVLSESGTQGNAATDDLMRQARARIGAQFDDLTARNNLSVTPELAGRLRDFEDSLRYLPSEAAAPVRARLEDINRMVSPDGILPGQSYRLIDSSLGRAMRGTGNGDLRTSLGELRDMLRGAMDDSIGPDDAAAWQEARRQYRNLMIAGRAVSGAGSDAAEGLISPLALKGAVDAVTPRDRRAFDYGPMRDLARLGQSVLRPPPDSGTAGRNYVNALLTGALPAAGAGYGYSQDGWAGAAVGAGATLALPRAVQMWINSPLGRRWLMNNAATRGASVTGPAAAAAAIAAQTD